jgi:hypothetical protein
MIYSNPRLKAVIDNWPIGGKRTTATFAVEVSSSGRGERGTRFTIDPKTGRPSATKVLTYADAVRIVDGDDGKTYFIELSRGYQMICVMESNMKTQAEVIHGGGMTRTDPRYADLLALFTG